MSNAINKIAATLSLAALLLTGASCSDGDARGAQELLSQGSAAVESRDFAGAIVILDTLNARYPQRSGERRQGLLLRATAMEGLALDSIAAGDAILAAASMEAEQLQPLFRHMAGAAGLEGYWLPADAKDNIMGATAVQGRVSDDGYFYVVANIQGRRIAVRTLELIQGADRVSTLPVSPARVAAVEGSETVSFSPEDVASLGPWLESHPNADKCRLAGEKGNVDIKLSAAARKELTQCFLYSRALQNRRLAAVHREKYERMLATARDQIANLTPATDDK